MLVRFPSAFSQNRERERKWAKDINRRYKNGK